MGDQKPNRNFCGRRNLQMKALQDRFRQVGNAVQRFSTIHQEARRYLPESGANTNEMSASHLLRKSFFTLNAGCRRRTSIKPAFIDFLFAIFTNSVGSLLNGL